MSQFWENLWTDRRTDGRTLFYRTLPAEVGGAIIEDQGIKQVEALKALKPEENQELKSIEGLLQKRWEILKLKMKQMKFKNVMKKLKIKN